MYASGSLRTPSIRHKGNGLVVRRFRDETLIDKASTDLREPERHKALNAVDDRA